MAARWMGRRVRIAIDVDLLRENVSKADGRPWTDAEVEQWLVDAGFTPDGDQWADLGQLEPNEVTHMEEVEDDLN